MLSAYETKVSMEPTKIEVKTKEPIDSRIAELTEKLRFANETIASLVDA